MLKHTEQSFLVKWMGRLLFRVTFDPFPGNEKTGKNSSLPIFFALISFM
jgi:hypothetical protein